MSVCKYVRESSAKRIGQTDKCVRERERETYAAADRQLSPRTAQQNMLRKGKGGSSSRATVATESTRTWQPARGTAISQQQHNSDKNNNNNKRQQEVSLATHAILHVPSMKAVGEGGGEGE